MIIFIIMIDDPKMNQEKNGLKVAGAAILYVFLIAFMYANFSPNPGPFKALVIGNPNVIQTGPGSIATNPVGSTISKYFMGVTLAGAFPIFDQQAGFADLWKASGAHSYDSDLLATMNWAHWQGNGLGLLSSELASAGNDDASLNNWASKTPTLTWKHWSRFVAFMQNMGTDMQTYGLLNIRTQKAGSGGIALLPTDDASNQLAIAEANGMIADAKAHGLVMPKVLAGVELSDTAVRPALQNDPQNYVTRAKAVALGVKAAYPDMKVVVGMLNPLNTTDPFVADWNTKIINSNTGTNKWFDYAGIYMVMDNDENVEQTCTTGDIDAKFNCFKTITHHYVSQIPTKMDARMQAYPGYKMVVNSWGTDNNGAAPGFSFSSYSVNNTMAQALYTADFLANVMRYNAMHGNVIESMYYLNGVGDNRAAISKYDATSDDVGNVVKFGTSMVKRATMHVFEMFASNFDGNHKMLGIAGVSLPTGIATDDVTIIGTKNIKAGATATPTEYIITNWTGQPINVADIKINGSAMIPATVVSAKVSSISGTALTSSYGQKNFTGTFSPMVITPATTTTNPGGIVIGKYSITKIVY